MDISGSELDLSGKLLIAMPGMGDPRFEKSVVYICAHSAEGAMGLIINKPSQELRLSDMLEQLQIPRGTGRDIRVHFGGPVEHGRGFVLHSSDYRSNSATTLKVDARFGLTATLDILDDMARGTGPDNTLLALGYSGWGPGQLEEEICANGWLTCDASPEIVFAGDDDSKWGRALNVLGVDPLSLSAACGHA
ncbi:MAG: hypothetical protein CL814_15515 [Confluentimicrobium sp.]|jgi:putative transcriptional regulator|nr:hypothetical protein [Actibacterium sp.]|tara:strand:+ start:3971 stop:4546 length:576 start_codon:yes stop_codon:yes gene_type:complete